MSCMILMFVMASTYPTSNGATNTDILVDKKVQDTIILPKASKIPAQTNRVYRVNNEIITVDTSKPGWAVSILLEDSPESN